MDLMSTKSSFTSDISQTSSLSAKLKRLKIDESLLLQSIGKYCVPDCLQTEYEVNTTSNLALFQFKDFSAKTKNSYREIKLIFQDLKTSTSSRELLKSLDIDDVKKSTVVLENRIKAFKLYLQSELTDLKTDEQKLNQTLDAKPVASDKLKMQPRIQTAKYNEIIPSPVKTIMTSPFKCFEVQRLQEFMMNSENRYGGWNEYHHNIFVNHWRKHFGSENFDDETEPPAENSPVLNLFITEILPKLQDIAQEDLISHIKWYSRYMYLKEQQQKAIDKWRKNRKIMRSAETEVKKELELKIVNKNKKNLQDISIIKDELGSMKDASQTSSQDNVRCFVRKCLTDHVKPDNNTGEQVKRPWSIENRKSKYFEASIGTNVQQPKLHFQKSTKQWNIRVNSKEIMTIRNVNNLGNIEKLCIPTWRANL